MSLARFSSVTFLALLSACQNSPRTQTPQSNPELRRISAASAINVPSIARPAEETPQWWFTAGAAAARANAPATPARAKNIIVFLGDGMSFPTVAAARIYAGQKLGRDGESYRLSFENFPFTALSRTYETDTQTPDSAGTMTAIMSGVKTKAGFIGVGQLAQHSDCNSARDQQLVSALQLAAVAGQGTGVVSTARLTHATPAATYGHNPNREWETDAKIPPAEAAKGCTDFARQLVEFPFGGGLDVALGGGRSQFMPADQVDPEYANVRGVRTDGKDLVAQWRAQTSAQYVWNADQFRALDLAATNKLLGLFEPSHMQYEHDRPSDVGGEPSLAELTRSAISMLKRHEKGFFLMVEGGRIDHAHHSGNAHRALVDTVAMSDAVQAALDATDTAETLIVVTADHAHTLTFVGYPARGNPILGKVKGGSAGEGPAVDLLGLPYTTLSYANGPGYQGASNVQAEGVKQYPHLPTTSQALTRPRVDLSQVDTENPNYLQEATLPMQSETHGGEDVPVYASGPGAASFHGSLEQNVLFHLMVNSSPILTAQLCAMQSCDENGVPVRLPSLQRLRELQKAQ